MFSRGDLLLALEEQEKKMRAAIEAEPEQSLKQADADEWRRPWPIISPSHILS
jgi:hypothetical protein